MSLRNILNHEPLPLHPYPPSSSIPLPDKSPVPDESSQLSPLPSPASHTSQLLSAEPRIQHRSALQLGWDSRSADWNVDDHSIERPQYPYDEDPLVSPVDPHPSYPHQTETDPLSRKRRKGNLDAEYVPTKPRRVRQTLVNYFPPFDLCVCVHEQTSQRKSSRKGKETRPMSPSAEVMDAGKVQDPSGQDSRLDSSDLEDCKEVWIEELDGYLLETKKRQTQVAQYFVANILVSLYHPTHEFNFKSFIFSLGT